jgi:hypothetical protein
MTALPPLPFDAYLPGEHVCAALRAFADADCTIDDRVLAELRAVVDLGLQLGLTKRHAERIVAEKFLEWLCRRDDVSAQALARARREPSLPTSCSI